MCRPDNQVHDNSHGICLKKINQMADQNKQNEDNISTVIQQILDELVCIDFQLNNSFEDDE